MTINAQVQTTNTVTAKLPKRDDVEKNNNLSDADIARIDETAHDFEAMFLSEMYKPIFDTVDVNEEFGGGKGEEMFRSFLRDEYAKELAKTNTLGIADLVKDHLIKMQAQANEPAMAQNMHSD